MSEQPPLQPSYETFLGHQVQSGLRARVNPRYIGKMGKCASLRDNKDMARHTKIRIPRYPYGGRGAL